MKGLKLFLQILLLFVCIQTVSAADQAAQQQHAFKGGEKLNYNLYYNLGFIWINAGHANFNVSERLFKGVSAFQFTVEGKTTKKFDSYYHVRDTFIAIVNKKDLAPMYAKREVREDGYWAQDEFFFSQATASKTTVVTDCRRKKNKRNIDTLSFNSSATDMITAIYRLRNFNFETMKVNEKRYFNIVFEDDNEPYTMNITYLGRDKVTLHNGDVYNCYKIRPTVLTGNVFSDENGMTVWVTSDENHIPVLVETPIRVGSLKVMLNAVANPMYPLTSKVPKEKKK